MSEHPRHSFEGTPAYDEGYKNGFDAGYVMAMERHKVPLLEKLAKSMASWATDEDIDKNFLVHAWEATKILYELGYLKK